MEGEKGTMKISDFMDLTTLQRIQDQFSDATGLAAIAVDAEGNYITKASNFTDFCIKYTRGSKEGLKRCVKCDTECSGTYFCHAGLMDFSVPIVVNGEKLGAVIGGQVLPKEADEDKFCAIANELGIDSGQYIQALRKVPVRPEKSIRAAAALLGDIINKVVNLEYLQKKDAKRLQTLDQEIGTTTDNVNRINERTKELEGIASKQNILALNATIESARAGAAGKGFSIIAGQMGDLSRKSGGIYQEISELAQTIKESVTKMNW